MYIHVRVFTEARSESFVQTKDLFFAARVKEKAVRDEANKKVAELVAAHFGIPTKSIRIVSGHRTPGKLFSIPDTT